MKKSTLWILLIVVVVVIGFILGNFIAKRWMEKRMNEFNFPETLVVNNHTKHDNADTLTMLILNKIFEIDSVEVSIFNAPTHIKNDDYEIAAFIQKHPFKSHSYFIFIKESGLPISLKRLLSHELIHLQQMENQDLIQIDVLEYVYKGDTIDVREVPYKQRPFEIDAFSRENKVRKELNYLLYRKKS